MYIFLKSVLDFYKNVCYNALVGIKYTMCIYNRYMYISETRNSIVTVFAVIAFFGYRIRS